MASLQTWVSEHKLTTVAGIWASAVGVSLAISSKRALPLKPSLKIIHARMYAQAVTLGVLGGAATLHYLDLNNVLADDGSAAVSSFDDFQCVADWY